MATDATTAPPVPKPPPTRLRKWLKRFAFVSAVFLLLLLLLPIAAMKWATSRAGGEYIRSKVLAGAGDAIQGRLEIGSIDLNGLLQLELLNVRLYAPGDTEPVVSIARVYVALDAAALYSRRVEV